MPRLGRRRFLGLFAAAGLGAACADDLSASERAAEAGVAGPLRIAYGDHRDAFADLWLPRRDGPSPVIVLVHGGFWREGHSLDLMDGLAASLAAAGYAAWNIEYRRGAAGGYPETFDDVAAAVDHVATLDRATLGDARLDLERLAVVGHSAGGQLATWIASRPALPPDAPWADPAVVPVAAVPQAGVLDLVRCAREGVGGSACPDLLGGAPEDVPERYELTSPQALLPVAATVLAVHGTADSIVPIEQSERYVAEAKRSGTTAELLRFDGADHFDVIDPEHESWSAVLERLRELLD